MTARSSPDTSQTLLDLAERTVWFVVGDVTNPSPEPFMVLSVDTSVNRDDGGVEGTVVSLHMIREEAERIVHEFNNGTLS